MPQKWFGLTISTENPLRYCPCYILNFKSQDLLLLIFSVREKKKNNFLFSPRYLCLLPCAVPRKKDMDNANWEALHACIGVLWKRLVGLGLCVHRENTLGEKPATLERMAKLTLIVLGQDFTLNFPVTNYLFCSLVFTSGEWSNLKTLARRRKTFLSVVYLCILLSLIQMFYISWKKTHFGPFWLICSMIYTWFRCFILLKCMILKNLTHSPSECLFGFLLLGIKACINYSLVDYKNYYTSLGNNTYDFTESNRI